MAKTCVNVDTKGAITPAEVLRKHVEALVVNTVMILGAVTL